MHDLSPKKMAGQNIHLKFVEFETKILVALKCSVFSVIIIA